MTNSSLVLTGKIFSLQSPRDPCRRALSKTKLNTATSPDLQAMGQEKGGKILLLKKKKKVPQTNQPKHRAINQTQQSRLNTLCAPTDFVPLTAWGVRPCFTSGLGLAAANPVATSAGARLTLVLLRKSTSSAAFKSGISEENKGITKCVGKISSCI